MPLGGHLPIASSSSQFIYRNAQHNFEIVNVPDGKGTPLTSSGGVRLSRPQWSYDGRYLSVTMYIDDNDFRTTKMAVIPIPNR